MKIAVLSDIHDKVDNLEKVLDEIKSRQIQAIIFCGDYASPTSFKKLAETRLETFAVFGNVDGDLYGITKFACEDYPNVTHGNLLLEFDLDNLKIAVTHYPKFARGLAFTGDYDAVFFGHTHQAHQEQINSTLLANPGEVHGGKGKGTFGIFDTQTRSFEIVEVK